MKGHNITYGICYRRFKNNKHNIEVYKITKTGPTQRKMFAIDDSCSHHMLATECMHELRSIMDDDSVITCIGVMGIQGMKFAFDTYSTKTDLPVRWKIEDDGERDWDLMMPLPVMKQPRHMLVC